MKLIIAYLPRDTFEPVRIELRDLGVHRSTISQVHSSSSQSVTTLQYRGAALDTYLQPEMRLECVATDAQSPAVVSVLQAHASRAGAPSGRVAVIELEELHPSSEDHISPDDPRLDTAVC